MATVKKRLVGVDPEILGVWKLLTVLGYLLVVFAVAQPLSAKELSLDTKRSLVALENDLGTRESPDDLEALALGAVSFLRAIEVSLQDRYRTGATLGGGMIGVPILRLPVQPNPTPEPFTPDLVSSIFASFAADMEQTRAFLSAARIGPKDKLVLDIAALWFDVDGNGRRGESEGVLEVAGVALTGAPLGSQREVPKQGLIVHFDAADVEWLVAYTHLLSAVSEVALAFDPTDVIAEIMNSNRMMAEIQGTSPPVEFSYLRGEEELIDAFAAVYGAINRVPEQARISKAREHLLEMIERNREFWALLEQETDNSFEWIPNASQDASLGFDLPAETGSVWQRVLADAEAVLKGELLIAHWRTEPGGGINVAKLLADAPAFDIVTWLQGYGLAPYFEKGPLVTWDSYNRFTAMFSGNAVLFMVLLN